MHATDVGRTCAFLCASVAWCTTPAAFAQSESPIEGARTAVEKWVETRRIVSAEKRDWALGRELLNDRTELLGQEIESLEARIVDAEKSITESDHKRDELVAEHEKLVQAAGALSDAIAGIEARTVELLRRLPDPVIETVRPLSQRIAEKPEESELSLGERFQNVVGILNEISRFHSEISVRSEVRTLAGGVTAEVTTMYVGIGQAYYITAKGDAAGIGTVSADGWVWIPANDAAPEIAKAIAMLTEGEVAEFVSLPVRIK